MPYADSTIDEQLHFLRLAPFAAGAGRGEYLGAKVLTVDGLGVREVHSLAIAREAAYAHFCRCRLAAGCRTIVLAFFGLGL